MAEPLAPCPFCGSTNVTLYGGSVGGKYVAALCHQCSAMGPEAETREGATQRWNGASRGRAPAPEEQT
jgi:Lar family restriction alleviation protein